jgi:hypothetical protein
LIHDLENAIPIGIAVQEGNYAEPNPATGKRASIGGLYRFATDYLHADYIFWFNEEPYYSAEVVPFMKSIPASPNGAKHDGTN